MKCPHCLIAFHHQFTKIYLQKDNDGGWELLQTKCPSCKKFTFFLVNGPVHYVGRDSEIQVQQDKVMMVWPKGSTRPPVPKEVPKQFAADYTEACLVIPDSPKASAALSRRCLQNLLRQIAKVKPGQLGDEIQEVLDAGSLPSYLSEVVDAIRNIGNFAAHPTKTQHTGEIVPVEPGEAEWLLDILESLFDFYFVQPQRVKSRREALNKKLLDAHKKPMK